MAKKQQGKWNKNKGMIAAACGMLSAHPLFKPLLSGVSINSNFDNVQLKDSYCQIVDTLSVKEHYSYSYSTAVIYPNYRRNLTAEEWAYILALAILHVVLNHIRPDRDTIEWRSACEVYMQTFAISLKMGKAPDGFRLADVQALPLKNEETLYQHFKEHGVSVFSGFGIAGSRADSWLIKGDCLTIPEKLADFRTKAFVDGLRDNVKQAIEGVSNAQYNGELSVTVKAANSWVINTFPLISALAASFKIIESEAVCNSMNIEIAAVHPELREVYINPRWSFNEKELRFILAHEFLHVGLRHDIRTQGRDPYLWNIACDYVINAWLVEMGVGNIPSNGMLYDERLKGRAAEDIYDEICKNLRWQRRLKKAQTLGGCGKPDVINDRPAQWWTQGEGVDLDTFYRRSLQEGQKWYTDSERGFLPAGLVEEIKALNQPPIPWDVNLAQWLDQFFPAVEKRRSYARMSRRQSATPDIPRPYWVTPEEQLDMRTFAVVLDTSGSMTRSELAKAIGAIASYALSREVAAVRVVYCDAKPYDAGYILSETLLHHVEVRGRGGTILQPAIELLQKAQDFPREGPILVITDGYIDHLSISRSHAYLMSKGQRLPFKTTAPVFYYE